MIKKAIDFRYSLSSADIFLFVYCHYSIGLIIVEHRKKTTSTTGKISCFFLQTGENKSRLEVTQSDQERERPSNEFILKHHIRSRPCAFFPFPLTSFSSRLKQQQGGPFLLLFTSCLSLILFFFFFLRLLCYRLTLPD